MRMCLGLGFKERSDSQAAKSTNLHEETVSERESCIYILLSLSSLRRLNLQREKTYANISISSIYSIDICGRLIA